MIALSAEPPGDRLPECDPAHRRLAQAVALQALLDLCHMDSEPAIREDARAFLFAPDRVEHRRFWLSMAGIRGELPPSAVEVSSLAQVVSRTLSAM